MTFLEYASITGILQNPTEARCISYMYILDTDPSIVGKTWILHQQQKRKLRTAFRYIANGRNVLSNSEINFVGRNGSFSIVNFVVKYRAYIGITTFKLREHNQVLS